jgi:hypothetical protein
VRNGAYRGPTTPARGAALCRQPRLDDRSRASGSLQRIGHEGYDRHHGRKPALSPRTVRAPRTGEHPLGARRAHRVMHAVMQQRPGLRPEAAVSSSHAAAPCALHHRGPVHGRLTEELFEIVHAEILVALARPLADRLLNVARRSADVS